MGSASAWNRVGTAKRCRWGSGASSVTSSRMRAQPVGLAVHVAHQIGEDQALVGVPGVPALAPLQLDGVERQVGIAPVGQVAHERAQHRRADAPADQPGQRRRGPADGPGPPRPRETPGSSRSTSARPPRRRCRGRPGGTKSGRSPWAGGSGGGSPGGDSVMAPAPPRPRAPPRRSPRASGARRGPRAGPPPDRRRG